MCRNKKRGDSFLTAIIEVMIFCVIVLSLFVVYISVFTSWQNGVQQQQLKKNFYSIEQPNETWGEVEAEQKEIDLINSSELGEAFSIIRAPSLWGEGKGFAIVKGTDHKSIMKSPGWYTETQLPGQKGNFALAGHEWGFGSPFEKMWEKTQTCDTIIVNTPTREHTFVVLPTEKSVVEEKKFSYCVSPKIFGTWKENYSTLTRPVYGIDIVQPHEGAVLRKIPFESNDAISEENQLSLITLQTCYPHFGNTHRIVVRAVLVKTEVSSGVVI